ncbi:MAG: GNAT family N-acetyltransferase [Ktedonobacterales bacterium]
MGIEIVPFTEDHTQEAAPLLAARHAADRRYAPALPERYERTAVCRELLRAEIAQPGVSGVAAVCGGKLTGYMLGATVLPDPNGNPLFHEERATIVRQAWHAVAPDGGEATYRALYGMLARQWLEQGSFAHYLWAPAAAGAALDTWYALGFTQNTVSAVSALTGTRGGDDDGDEPRVGCGDWELRRAGPDDLETVLELCVANMRFHAEPPTFFPLFPELEASMRPYMALSLADPDCACWLAERDGQVLGLQTFARAGDALQTPERAVYLDHGFTVPEARGTGVGSALLARTRRWAREAGYDRCTLMYAPANPLSSRFWPAHGFRPLYYRLARRIDPRIIWARG